MPSEHSQPATEPENQSFLFAGWRYSCTPDCSHKRAAGPRAPGLVAMVGPTGRQAGSLLRPCLGPWSFPVVNSRLIYLAKGSQPGWDQTREQSCKLSLAPERLKTGPEKKLDSRKVNIL